MIVATPVDLPIIKPDNWDVFWDIWNKHSAPLRRKEKGQSYTPELAWQRKQTAENDTVVWEGLDIYLNVSGLNVWEAPYYNIEHDLPEMYQQIKNLPIPNIHTVSLLRSKIPVGAHTDTSFDRWLFRAFLYNPSEKQQWYFTDPKKERYKKYLTMPETTNWFAFNDRACKHGCDYDPNAEKILLSVLFHGHGLDLLTSSFEKYKEYLIYDHSK